MKKKLNPFGKEGKLLLCNSCGSYRHFVAKCPDSWENMVKREDNVGNVNSAGQSNTEKIRGNKELSGEAESHIGERCNAPNAVVVEELAVEVTRLKREIRSLKDEITEIKTDRDEELKRRKKKLHSHVKNLEEVKERHEKQTRVIAKELDERYLKLEKKRRLVIEETNISEFKRILGKTSIKRFSRGSVPANSYDHGGCHAQGPVQFYIMTYPPPYLLETRETMALDPYLQSEALASVSCDRL